MKGDAWLGTAHSLVGADTANLWVFEAGEDREKEGLRPEDVVVAEHCHLGIYSEDCG